MSAHTLLLQQFSLLRLLSAEALDQIAPLASTRDFAKREMILAKGPPVPYLCFLMEGRLQAIDFTLDGREVGLYFIEQGDYFGELSLIDEGPQPEFVIATGRARVVLLPGAEIRPILFSNPSLAEALSKRLAQRVRQQLNQRQILAVNNPLHRICAQLQIMISATTTSQTQPIAIRSPTHQELTIMVNLTRETVTRTFQVLLAQGVLTRQGDQLLVDKEKLGKLAQGGEKGA